MVDRKGVIPDRNPMDLEIVRIADQKYIWIGDDRWSVRYDDQRRWDQFRYGIYKEIKVSDRLTYPEGWKWELQTVALWKWSARFILWRTRKFYKRAEKAQRPNGRYG